LESRAEFAIVGQDGEKLSVTNVKRAIFTPQAIATWNIIHFDQDKRLRLRRKERHQGGSAQKMHVDVMTWIFGSKIG
jgi:hypothetical protein